MQLFELLNKAKDLRQGGFDVTQYFSMLQQLWQEVDLFNTFSWKDPEDALLFQKLRNKERVYDFLAGLNRELDEVRGRLLGRHPLPFIDKVFAEVRREEHRRHVMLSDSPSFQLESSVMAAHYRPALTKKALWCDHRNKSYHTWDTCWDIHGKPANWVPNRLFKKGPTSHDQCVGTLLASTSSIVNFSKAQVEHLCILLSSSTTTISFFMAQTGISGHFVADMIT